MTDDTERRLRESLRAANLPGAPETLRVSMRAIASASAPAASRWRRPWSRVLPALAAVVVVAVAAGALSGGFGRFGPIASASGSGAPASSGTGTGTPTAVPSSTSAAVPSPGASASPATAPHIYSPSELQAALAADRASLVGRQILVEGRIRHSLDPHGLGHLCSRTATGETWCAFDALDGTAQRVYVSGYTRQLIPRDMGPETAGVLAMRVRADGLEYLGRMRSGGSGGFRATVADLNAELTQAAGPGFDVLDTLMVDAWLVASPPIPCPMQPAPGPPADTPFITCPWARLTPTEEPMTTVGDSSVSLTPPADGVRVQWSAYNEFAPGKPTSSAIPQPRFGTYLVRLVVDTSKGPDGPRGWQVVGRLAP